MYSADTQITAAFKEGVTLYAQWSQNVAVVTFDYNDDVTADKTVNVEAGKTVAEDAVAAPVREGYRFEGWYNGEDKLIFGETVISKNVTYTAKWTQVFALTVDGEVVATLAEGETYQLPVPAAEPGRTFIGWARGGAILYSKTQNTVTMGTSAIALTQAWADHGSIKTATELAAAYDDGAQSLTLAADITLGYGLIIEERTFSLDLGGHTLTIASPADGIAPIYIYKNGDVTVSNGSLNFTGTYSASVNSASTTIFVGLNVDDENLQQAIDENAVCKLTLNDVDLTSFATALFIGGNGELVMNGGSVTAEGAYALGTNATKKDGVDIYAPATATVTGTAEDPVAITAKGALTDGGNEGDAAAVLINVDGSKFTFKYVSVTAPRQGMIVRAGEVDISDSAVTLLGTYADGNTNTRIDTAWGWGNEVVQAVIVVGDTNTGSYNAPATLTIADTALTIAEGATVDSDNLFTIYAYNDGAKGSATKIVGQGYCNAITVGANSQAVSFAHSYGALIAEVPATCTKNGVKAHYACSVCGKLFTEADGVYTEVTEEDLAISAAGHDYGDAVTYDAETGTVRRGCTHCDAAISATVTVEGASLTEESFVWNDETKSFTLTLPAAPVAPTGKYFAGWLVTVNEDGDILQPAAAVTIADGATVTIAASLPAYSAEHPLTIGTPDNNLAFTANDPLWKGTINVGEIVTMSGTMTSRAEKNYHTVLMYLWSQQVVGEFRFDWWVSDNANDGTGAQYAAEEGWTIAKTAGPTWETFLASIINCNITLTYDWSKAGRILVTFHAVGIDNNVAQTMTYTITPVGTAFGVQTYNIGLGGEASYTVIDRITISYAADPVYSENQTDPVIGSEDCTLGFTNLTPVWIGNPVQKGGKVVLSGTVRSAGTYGYEVPIAYLFSTASNDSVFRLDGFNGNTAVAVAEGWNVAVQEGIENADTNYDLNYEMQTADTAFLTAIKSGVTFTLTYDWTDESKIVITAEFSDGSDMTRTTTYTITPAGASFASDSYNIGLGGEHIYLQITSIERS